MSVTAIIGGQFGSEGKGLIVGHLAKDYDVHVRVGAANAGHTLYSYQPLDGPHGGLQWKSGWEKHVMQQLPCAAYANPEATLAIGPGALISPEILADELHRLGRWRRDHGLSGEPGVYVDPRAHVITHDQIVREAETSLAARIGSTSAIAREGIGVAQSDRVMRGALGACVTAEAWIADGGAKGAEALCGTSGVPIRLTDVPILLARANAAGKDILLEGTQGTGLSLTTGFFPYVTSRNVTAAGLAADCGVAPNAIDRVIGVFRTYPIRVAGPSGPFYDDSEEIEWSDIGVDPEKERTTVTKKVRRVATWSQRQLWEACQLNGVTDIALTFADYLDPRLKGVSRLRPVEESAAEAKATAMSDRMDDIERCVGIRPRWVGTGPHSVVEPWPVRSARAA